jgi:hypothetical protein
MRINFALFAACRNYRPWMVANSSSINVSENEGRIITSDEVSGRTMRNGRMKGSSKIGRS